jgi:hypothetical protein
MTFTGETDNLLDTAVTTAWMVGDRIQFSGVTATPLEVRAAACIWDIRSSIERSFFCQGNLI